MNILQIVFVYLFQIISIFSFGLLLGKYVLRKTDSWCLIFVSGFLLLFALFELIALPITLLKLSLNVLVVVWMIITVAAIAGTVLLGRGEIRDLIKSIPGKLQAHSWGMLVLIICFGVQMFIVFTHIDNSADAAYYVGKVSTDVYTNTLGRFDPYTGEALKKFEVRYLFSCFPDYNAVICKVFGIHPLQQTKIIMSEIVILIANLLYYQVGMALFSNDRKKAAGMTGFICLINLYSNTIYTAAAFLLTRTYEGKAILANVIVTAMIFGFIHWVQGNQELYPKIVLLLAAFASVTFSSSSMIMVPVAFAVMFLVLTVMNRNIRHFGWFFLYILPNFLVAVVYLLAKQDILLFQL